MRKLAGIIGALLATAGIAAAAFVAVTTMSGQVTTGDFQVFLNSSVTASASSGTCTASQVDSSTLNVVWSGPIAGDTCTITTEFQGLASNGGTAVLEGVILLGVVDEVRAVLGTDCGVTITGAETVNVSLLLTVTGSASPGVGYDLAGAWSWAPAGTADVTGCV